MSSLTGHGGDTPKCSFFNFLNRMTKINLGLTSDQEKYAADMMQLIITVCNACPNRLHDTDAIHIVSEKHVDSMGSPQVEFRAYMHSRAGILNPVCVVFQLRALWPQFHDMHSPYEENYAPLFYPDRYGYSHDAVDHTALILKNTFPDMNLWVKALGPDYIDIHNLDRVNDIIKH